LSRRHETRLNGTGVSDSVVLGSEGWWWCIGKKLKDMSSEM
jgi:hypothetical protein